MVSHHGFGKIILFGEHFVVYGCKAIASAIDKKTIVHAKKTSNGIKVVSGAKDPVVVSQMAKAIAQKMQVDQNFEIKIDSDIPVGSGLGSSASLNVGIAKALNELFKKNLSLQEICDAAYEGEKVAHGTPSGIDNTVATYGGILFFKKNLQDGANFIETKKISKPISIVIANSGKHGSTKEMVALVREKKEKNPQWFEELLNKENKIIQKAQKALQQNDLDSLGKLMNENHALLKEIGVSTPELELLVKTCLENGALGAKITGGGGGGCIFALTKPSNQNAIAKAIEKKGFKAYKTKIGV